MSSVGAAKKHMPTLPSSRSNGSRGPIIAIDASYDTSQGGTNGSDACDVRSICSRAQQASAGPELTQAPWEYQN